MVRRGLWVGMLVLLLVGGRGPRRGSGPDPRPNSPARRRRVSGRWSTFLASAR